jgi:hypothetical protein
MNTSPFGFAVDTRVNFLDPVEAPHVIGRLQPVAEEAAARLRRVAAALQAGAK